MTKPLQLMIRAVAVLALVAVLAPTVKADVIYEITGTFGTDAVGTSGLAGGSFQGTFAASGLPFAQDQTLHSIDSYHVNLLDNTGSLVATLDSANTTVFTGIYTGFDPGGGNALVDVLNLTDGSNGYSLQLDFLSPFNGNGPVISQNDIYQDQGSYGGSPDGLVNVATGASVAAIPEPSSLVLAGVVLLVAVNSGWRHMLK